MNIKYKLKKKIKAHQFRDLLRRSNLGERRPVEDMTCLTGMLENSDLIITAWSDGELIGIARSVTDFHYCCYLSDLAVDEKHQSEGIGKQLQMMTQAQLGPKCSLILLAAPAANSYYKHIGFTQNERCWILARDEVIKT